MRNLLPIWGVLFGLVLCSPVNAAGHQPALTELLAQVEKSITKTQQIDQSRLEQFLQTREHQAELLSNAKARLLKAELQQERLTATFDQNEAALMEQAERLKNRSGQLGEVFGVVKQQAQDLGGVLQDSLITTEYPHRLDSIAFANEKRIPTLSELQSLWYLMLQEMTATAEVKRYAAQVAQPDGQYQPSELIRIGPFVAVDSLGRFLKHKTTSQQLEVLTRQPGNSEQAQAAAFFNGSVNSIMIDPSRGNLLELIGRTPSVKERIDQAGAIGYLIIALGGLGLLVACWRFLAMIIAELKIKNQLKNLDQLTRNNPLGRVLKTVNQSAQARHEEITSTEIRLDEALLKEVPPLEYGLTFLKLLAAVAPLLGLLGTVTGMIGTFQSITVFGTSDPKLMAGGISQALMTTVLGLCVAIPLLFSHSLISARVRRLVQLLQQVAFSSLAEHLEHAASIKLKQHKAEHNRAGIEGWVPPRSDRAIADAV